MRIWISVLMFAFLLSACQKSKWNRRLAVRSGKYKLTRYEVNDQDKTSFIQSFMLDFKGKDPGVGNITELITNAGYGKGYNSCFNFEGAVHIPDELSTTGIPIVLSFANNKTIENTLGFIEVNHYKYGCTRSILPKEISRTKFVFEFPFNAQLTKADTSIVVREKYVFEKLP